MTSMRGVFVMKEQKNQYLVDTKSSYDISGREIPNISL